MVEFALTLPIFLVFVFGIVEVGRAMYTRGGIGYAVEEGARVGALAGATSDTIVKNAVNTAIPGISTATVTVTITDSAGKTKAFTARTLGDRIIVSATISFTPIAKMVFPGSPTFSMTARTEREVE